MRHLSVPIIVALALTACGGGDDAEPGGDDTAADAATDTPADAPADESADETADDPGDEASGADTNAATSSGVEHPVVRFAAHGPAEPNTWGPSCAMGIETSALNTVRVTAPPEWAHGGSSGGTGSSSVYFNLDGGTVTVDVATADYDRDLIGNIVAGAEVATVDLDGTSVPIVEVMVDDRAGYAIDSLVWLEPLPELFGGAMSMTVTITGSAPDLFTLDEAVAILGSVRVERCAAVMEAMTAMGAVPVLAVPEFSPDPLGKTYPGGDQPEFDMMNMITAYSTEQLAYLLPVESPTDACVAASLQAELPDVFIIGMSAIAPVEGEQQDTLQAIVDGC